MTMHFSVYCFNNKVSSLQKLGVLPKIHVVCYYVHGVFVKRGRPFDILGYFQKKKNPVFGFCKKKITWL